MARSVIKGTECFPREYGFDLHGGSHEGNSNIFPGLLGHCTNKIHTHTYTGVGAETYTYKSEKN